MTLRDAMKAGLRGNFAKCLLEAYEHEGVRPLIRAYLAADEQNRERLDAIFEGIEEVGFWVYDRWPRMQRHGLEAAFPGLCHLDEPTDDLHAIDLATGQPKAVRCDSATVGD